MNGDVIEALRRRDISRRSQTVFTALGTIILALCALAFAGAQEKPGNPRYDWLNGKWSGSAPTGGELELDLKVVNENQISGQSRIPRAAAKREAVRTVTGSVEGETVHLELYQAKTGATQKWSFVHKDGILRATRKGEEFVFKKAN
jgi:hypothetical protein